MLREGGRGIGKDLGGFIQGAVKEGGEYIEEKLQCDAMENNIEADDVRELTKELRLQLLEESIAAVVARILVRGGEGGLK